ncbi:MAG: cation transporting ATPase C-terminal domain-containing protein, partial [Myxococcaceae bacterium]
INDAPALHAADVGISVDQAVDVARESADVILLKRDLEVLRRGVEEGRRTFANTLKYISLATSSTFGNMISMALATPLLPFIPLLAKQILLNNFLSDLPAISLSADRVDEERLKTPQRWDVGQVQRFMLVFGLTSTAFDFVTFGVLLLVFHAGQALFQTAWFVLSMLTELVALLVLRTRRPVYESRPGRLLTIACAVVGVIALALPFTGPLAKDLGFVALNVPVVAAALAIVIGYLVALELAKRLVFRRTPAKAA